MAVAVGRASRLRQVLSKSRGIYNVGVINVSFQGLYFKDAKEGMT